MKQEFVAVLSSTVLTNGVFRCEEIPFPTNLEGIPHFVGHPATRAILEALGAVKAPTNLFAGLEVRQSYLAVPLAANARPEGMTVDTAIADISALKAKKVTRLE